MTKIIRVAGIVLVDQIVKLIVRLNMQVGESIPVIQDVFHITYVQNKGVAWGTFQGETIITIVVPLILIAAIIVFMIKKTRMSKFLSWALTLVVGGGLSNQIDRIFLGGVTDMIDIRVWPVFNIADMAVVVGCFMVIIYVIFLDKGKRA